MPKGHSPWGGTRLGHLCGLVPNGGHEGLQSVVHDQSATPIDRRHRFSSLSRPGPE
jgi:hypothetical protein